MSGRVMTDADRGVRECLEADTSFALIAGAGSGKTSSLVDALMLVRERCGDRLRQDDQRIACITYTKRAVEVISSRLGFDELYAVSTLHNFLWGQLGHFQRDIKEVIRSARLPALIAKEQAADNGGNSRVARDARARIERYRHQLGALDNVNRFEYRDLRIGDYTSGTIGHDDVVAIASYLFAENPTFRRIVGFRFPYIFVDEAQDTFAGIVDGLNLTCAGSGLPVVGYFGDPWQQIFEGSVGTFSPPPSGRMLTKTENFRCSEPVIDLLNAFRNDVKQYAAGDNKRRSGSVLFRLIKGEVPAGERKRYSEDQLQRAQARMDDAIEAWGWTEHEDVIRLFLVRQMIARRMGFSSLNRLFTGFYSSARSEDAFQRGEHFLLVPLIKTVLKLVVAQRSTDDRTVIEVLRNDSPAFAVDGVNARRTLKDMVDLAKNLVRRLVEIWDAGTIKEVLEFCVANGILHPSEKLLGHVERDPRRDEYNEEIHSLDKGDWLADALFMMPTDELSSYASFLADNTAYSTQHGVKGEEYSKVVVVYDDVEAGWANYSFCKLLTPATAGNPTDGQLERGRKLAYVSFSRALEDLRVLLFTPDPIAARAELVGRKLVRPEQIEIVE